MRVRLPRSSRSADGDGLSGPTIGAAACDAARGATRCRGRRRALASRFTGTLRVPGRARGGGSSPPPDGAVVPGPSVRLLCRSACLTHLSHAGLFDVSDARAAAAASPGLPVRHSRLVPARPAGSPPCCVLARSEVRDRRHPLIRQKIRCGLRPPARPPPGEMQDREVNRWFRVSKQVLRRAADDILRRFSPCVRQRDEGKGKSFSQQLCRRS